MRGRFSPSTGGGRGDAGQGDAWQVDVAAVVAIDDGADQELRAEVVFVVDMPYLTVVRVVHQEGAHHGVARTAALLSLFCNIRQEPIAQLPPPLDNGGDSGIVPRFALASAVVAHVGGEHAKLRPAHIDLLV